MLGDPTLSEIAAAATTPWALLALPLLVVALVGGARRASRVVPTVRARAWAVPVSRHLARRVRGTDATEEEFFAADGAEPTVVARRRAGLARLAHALRERAPQSVAWGRQLRESFSDLRFTDANRVPFRFARLMRERFDLSTVVTASRGPRLCDLDNRWTLDVSGSYGVNVAGFDRYKEWIARGWERVRDLGPVLGPLHPVVADNIGRLKAISGLDEVSFHMSGTEAVMAAVRLARFNTRRKRIVTFAGAYHGWWDGVQPGLGSERAIDDCLTLKDMHPASLEVIRRRAGEIAAVLVNPVQSFHPNSPPPSDTVLLTHGVRQTSPSASPYGRWLQELRAVCTEAGVPLIFDEVYSGFRLAPGGAQEYFGVQADMVVYGKTVAGGLPIGVVCGRAPLMRRFDPGRPMRIAYVIGTFAAHPLVMGAMNEFLRWVTDPDMRGLYERTEARCTDWVRSTNRQLEAEALPVRIAHLGTIWTVLFTEPGRHHWLLQYYLRAHGLTLSWVGTGRCLVSLDFEPADFDELRHAVVAAARAMRADGWWVREEEQPGRARVIRRRLARELLASLVPAPVACFAGEVMRRKHDDHVASHNNFINRVGHLLSSSAFILCYGLVVWDYTWAMGIGLAALFVRQLGHAVFEPPCHDKEELLLGFTTRSKTLVVAAYLGIPVAHLLAADTISLGALAAAAPAIAWHWLLLTIGVVLGHVVYLWATVDLRSALVWFVKLVTDPFTDLVAYTGPCLRTCREWLQPRLQASGAR